MCDRCEEIDYDSMKEPTLSGTQFGVSFYDLPYDSETVQQLKLTPEQAKNRQFRIFSEDDELWHFTGCSASVEWIDDLISVLQHAQEYLREK